MNPKYSEMVKDLAKSGEAILSEMTPADAHLLHMALGMSGEAAEIQEYILGHEIHHDEFDRMHMLKELGDVEFYYEGAVQGTAVRDLEQDESIKLEPDPAYRAYEGNDILVLASRLSVFTGRALDAVKKRALYRKELDVVQYSRAMLWIRLTMDRLAIYYNTTHEECLAINQEKLAKRYGAKYSNQAAQTRADETPATPA